VEAGENGGRKGVAGADRVGDFDLDAFDEDRSALADCRSAFGAAGENDETGAEL